MAAFTVWAFDSPGGADAAVATLGDLRRQHLIDLRDAAIVTWPEGARKPKTRQLRDATGAGALVGAFWGFVLGFLFVVPLLGMVVGGAMGALMGSLADVGIPERFIRQVRDNVRPGTSALFLYTANAVPDRVLEQLRGAHGHVELIESDLSSEQETKLRDAFGEE
jgi:uncharacterized membrane protein